MGFLFQPDFFLPILKVELAKSMLGHDSHEFTNILDLEGICLVIRFFSHLQLLSKEHPQNKGVKHLRDDIILEFSGNSSQILGA